MLFRSSQVVPPMNQHSMTAVAAPSACRGGKASLRATTGRELSKGAHTRDPRSTSLRRRAMLLASCVMLGALANTVACQTYKIPNTDVDDTDQNRAIIDFCETYRKAVERRNVRLLMQLAHPNYYEDGGNIDSADDIDRMQLQQYLEGRFSDAKAIRYEIRYRRIGQGRKDRILVDYTYSASYQLPTENGDVWRRTVAENRLELVPHQDGYLILAGM